MLHLEDIIRQLNSSAEAMRALLHSVPVEQAQWKPDADTWSLQEVMGHIYNEERVDFRKHLKEMLNDPPLAWQRLRPEDQVSVTNLQQALDGFLRERADSLAWLQGLQSPDWEGTSQAPWGTIRAGDVLASWVEHDFLHMRQLVEVLYAWNKQQALPYEVQYAGDW